MLYITKCIVSIISKYSEFTLSFHCKYFFLMKQHMESWNGSSVTLSQSNDINISSSDLFYYLIVS